MNEEAAIMTAWSMKISGRMSRGRQRIRWRNGGHRRITELGLTEEDAFDRVRWKRYIKEVDPT